MTVTAANLDDGTHAPCVLGKLEAAHYPRLEVILADNKYHNRTSWKALLLDCVARGMTIATKLAVGDRAVGFWKAFRQVFPMTQEQRCWMHKTANVLDKLPKGQQPKAKAMLHDIWQAETKAEAEKAFDLFVATWEAKYAKATDCLLKDRKKCWSSMTSRPCTGYTCGRPTRLNRRSPRCGCERPRGKEAALEWPA